MGMLRLAERLSGIACTIREHADNLDDNRFIKEAGRFTKALDRFTQALDSVREGLTPRASELKMLLHASFPPGDDTIVGSAKFSLKVLGKKTPRMTLPLHTYRRSLRILFRPARLRKP